MLSIACRWSGGTSQPNDCKVKCIMQLPDTANGQQNTSLDDVATGSKALLVLWICNHCPFVLATIGALLLQSRMPGCALPLEHAFAFAG